MLCRSEGEKKDKISMTPKELTKALLEAAKLEPH